MTELALPLLAPAAEATGWARLRSVVLLSLLVTGGAALVAVVPAAVSDVRWSWAFVMIRWMVVFVLLALPLVHQVARARGASWALPWGLRTPATGLLLTLEGIVWDIVSAQLTH
jgi:hypothetical protein